MIKEVRASHILVKTEGEALNLLSQMETEREFSDLARAYSECPSGKKGGDLGFFSRGQMVREFEEAAFSSEPGQITGPVKTQFGYHLIRVTDKR